jgi:mannose-6-phosphate isomerase-like protein (cupin superfamily)
LDFHPEIWNEIPYRTRFPESPHREVDDVWVRYNALENYTGDGAAFNAPHTSVWYPVVDKLPSARLLALELYQRLEGERLGGVLITRIPPYKQVYPHVDPGWHARFYEKFVIQLRGNGLQAFCFEGEELSVQSGECYWFDNSVPHWVTNESYSDRISLIVCIRRPQCH